MHSHLILTCPTCGTHQKQPAPKGYCVYFHGCPTCTARLRSKQGDRCIFQSYRAEPPTILIAAE